MGRHRWEEIGGGLPQRGGWGRREAEAEAVVRDGWWWWLRGTDGTARQAPRKAAAGDASGLRRHVKMGRAVQKGGVCGVEEAVIWW